MTSTTSTSTRTTTKTLTTTRSTSRSKRTTTTTTPYIPGGTNLKTIQIAQRGFIAGLGVLPSNGYVVSATHNGFITVFSQDGTKVNTFNTNNECNTLAVLQDESIAIARYTSSLVDIWLPLNSTFVKTLSSNANGATNIFYLLQLINGHLACANRDRSIRLLNIAADNVSLTLTGHNGPVNALVQLNNGNIASTGEETITGFPGKLCIWDLSNPSTPIKSFNLDSSGNALAVLANLNKLAVGTEYSLYLYDTNNWDTTAVVLSTRKIQSLTAFSNGFVVSGDRLGNIIVWDTVANVANLTIPSFESYYSSILKWPCEINKLATLSSGSVAAGLDGISSVELWKVLP